MKKTFNNQKVLELLMSMKDSQIADKELPIKFLWALKCNTDKLQEVAKMFEGARQNLVDKYVANDRTYIPDGDTGNVMVKEEFLDMWRSDNQELLNIETEFDFKPVSIDILDGINLKPSECAFMEFMIEE